MALLAAPAHADVSSPPCYPPPCAATGPDVLILDSPAAAPVTVVSAGRADTDSPVPFVGAGLLLVALTFAAIASSRRPGVVRQAQLALASADATPTAAERVPSRTGSQVGSHGGGALDVVI